MSVETDMGQFKVVQVNRNRQVYVTTEVLGKELESRVCQLGSEGSKEMYLGRF